MEREGRRSGVEMKEERAERRGRREREMGWVSKEVEGWEGGGKRGGRKRKIKVGAEGGSG